MGRGVEGRGGRHVGGEGQQVEVMGGEDEAAEGE